MYKFALVLGKSAAFAFLAVASANASWQADCINPWNLLDTNMRCYTRACFMEMPNGMRAARANYSDQCIKLHATLRRNSDECRQYFGSPFVATFVDRNDLIGHRKP